MKQVPSTPDGHRRELMRLLRENATRADLWTVWSDFIELAALSIANAVDRAQRAPREARYMAIIGRYDKDQVQRFAHALGALTMALEAAGFDDVLGSVFMELELGSKWAGQFFTPYQVCSLMARMNVGGELPEKLAGKGFVTVSDPCVGAGAMPIAMAQALHDAGHNYQRCMHVTAQDIDSRAVHMAYIQLSLLHVPAVVILGNSLAVECREQWFTPAHVIGGWSRKLADRADPDAIEDLREEHAQAQDALFTSRGTRREGEAQAAALQALDELRAAEAAAEPDLVIGQPELEGLFD